MAFILTAQVTTELNQASVRKVRSQIDSIIRGVKPTNIEINVSQASQAVLANVRAGLADIRANASGARTAVNGLTQSLNNVAKAQTAINSAASTGNTIVGGLNQSLANLATNVVGITAIGLAFRAGIREAIEFQSSLIRVRQVSEGAGTEVAAVGQEVSRLSQAYGVSSRELVQQALVLKQAGLSARETTVAMTALAKASLAPNFSSMTETTQGAIAVMGQFKIKANDLEGALGSMNAVAAQYATEASDLVTGTRKAGGAFAAAGGNLNEFLALFTSVRSTTRETAEEVATGMRTIFGRIQRPQTIDALRSMGIELRDAKGQFVGAFESVRRLNEGLSGLKTTDPRFTSIVEQLGGVRNLSRTIPLIQQFSEAQKALNVAKAGSVSLDINAAQAQDAYTVRLTKIREQFLAVSRDMLESRGFRVFAEVLEKGASAAVTLTSSLTPLLPLLGAIGLSKGLGMIPGAVGGIGKRGLALGAAGAAAVGIGFAQPLFDSAGPTGSGIGTGLQGALAGGIGGSAFGPWGIAIGASTGAVIGFTSALQDAKQVLVQSKIDAAQTVLTDRLGILATGASPSALSEAADRVNAIRSAAREKAANNADHLFGQDPKQYLAGIVSEETKALGPALTGIVNALNVQAESIGRRSPNADPSTLARELRSSAGPLIDAAADRTGRTRQTFLRDLLEVIKSAQSSALTSKEGNRIAIELDRQSTAYGRLTSAIEKAQFDLSELGQEARAVGGILSGDLSAVRPGALNISDGAMLGRLSLPLGATGERLTNESAALEKLTDVLPVALSRLASEGPTTGEALSAQLRDLLRDALGGDLNGATGRGVDSVLRAFDDKKPEDVLKAIGGDVSKLSDELLSTFGAAIETTRKRLADLAHANAGQFVEGLASSARAQQTIGQERDAISGIRLGSIRFRAGKTSERTARGPTDLISLRDLQAPYVNRQERLAGADGLDPIRLAARLAEVQAAIPKATTDRDNLIGTKEFAGAARRLQDLQSQSVNLTTALRNLTDVSARAAGIQEKLNALQSNKDSRLGYAERFLSGDYNQRNEMRRGQQLVALASRRGSLRGFAADDQRAILGTLSDLGQAKLPGLGDVRADLLKRQLLTQALGGQIQAPGDAKDEAALKGQLGDIHNQAEIAQRLLADGLTKAHTDFLGRLENLQSGFFVKLEAQLTRVQLAEKQTALGDTGRRLGELRAHANNASLLGSADINSDTQVSVLQANRAELQNYASALAAKQANDAKLNSLSGADLSGFAPDARRRRGENAGSYTAQAEQFLRENFGDTLTPDQIQGVARRYSATGGKRMTEAIRKKQNPDAGLQQALREALIAEMQAGLGGPNADIEKGRARFGALGFNAGRLESQLGAGAGTAFLKALDSFNRTDNRLETLGQRIESTAKAFGELEAAVNALRGAAGGPVQAQGKAMGGAIFGARGTDVVPAMLTPGEFVVNATSARANASLLESINRKRGPVYLASGGPVDHADPRFLKALVEQRQRDYERSIRESFVPARDRDKLRNPDYEKAYRKLASDVATGNTTLSDAEINRHYEGDFNRFLGSAPSLIRGKVKIRNEQALDDFYQNLRDANSGTTPLEKFKAKQDAQAAQVKRSIEQARQNPFSALGSALARADSIGAARARDKQYGLFARHFGPGPTENDVANPDAGPSKGVFVIPSGPTSSARQTRATQFGPMTLEETQAAETRRLRREASALAYANPTGPAALALAEQRLRRRNTIGPQTESEAQRNNLAIAGGYRQQFESGDLANLQMQQVYARASGLFPGDEAQAIGAVNSIGIQRASSDRAFRSSYSLMQYEAGQARPRRRHFASGGPVGTDTLPAWLTPGEFVLNRDAANAIGGTNLERLNNARGFAEGGQVGSAPAPGFGLSPEAIQAMQGFSENSKALTASLTGFTTPASELARAMTTFNAGADKLAGLVDRWPREVTHEVRGETVVHITGAEAFEGMEERFQKMMTNYVQRVVEKNFNERLPDAPARLRGDPTTLSN